MTAKSDAERAREYRKRRADQAVENPITRDEIVTLLVTFRDEIVTQIVTKIRHEIERHIVITPSSGPPAPSEEGGGMRHETASRKRDGLSSNGARSNDAIDRCHLCDQNGFIRVDDPTGAPTVRLCKHA